MKLKNIIVNQNLQELCMFDILILIFTKYNFSIGSSPRFMDKKSEHTPGPGIIIKIY
jgi:hypothetical protein